MKKRHFLSIISVFLVILLSACSNADGKADADLQAEIQRLEENAQLKNQIATLQSDGTITDNTNTEPIDNDNTIPIKTGETFQVGDIMEITLQSSEWCEEIYPSIKNGGYTYYGDIDGEKFFVIRGELKNLSGEIFNISYISDAKLLINGKYKATATLENENADGNGFYGEVKPLQTLNLVIFSSISDDLYNSCESMTLTMYIISDEKELDCFYNDNISHETFTISFTK